MRARLGIWLLFLLGACDARPLVVVSVSPLPPDSAELLVSLTYDGKPAKSPSPIRFSLVGVPRDIPTTFGVRLEANTDNDLVVGAGVLDTQGCLAAFGSATSERISLTAKLDLALHSDPVELLTLDERCMNPESTPILLGVSPPSASTLGGDRVVLRGWGFDTDTCSSVSINAMPMTNILCPSLVELSANVPPGSQVGPATVQVLNRNGLRSVTTGLFSYYARTIQFGGAMSYAVGQAPSALIAGFVDGDDRPDLLVANRDSGTVTVLVNSGLGDFPPARMTTLDTGVRPSAVGLGDINGDKRADVLAVNANDQTVSVHLQAPLTVPSAFMPPSFVFVNLLPSAISLGDVNQDGLTDVVVGNQLGNDVSLLRNEQGTLKKSARDYSVPREPVGVILADLNSDGRPDLLVRSTVGSSLTVMLNADGDFPSLSRSSILFPAPPTALAVADLDGDGAPDAVLGLGDGTVRVLWNDGSGFLKESPDSPPVAVADVSALAASDLDLDGNVDVVAASAAEQRLYVLRNIQKPGAKGLARLPSGYPVGRRPVAIAVADFNGDGRPDIAVANQNDNNLSVLFNASF